MNILTFVDFHSTYLYIFQIQKYESKIVFKSMIGPNIQTKQKKFKKCSIGYKKLLHKGAADTLYNAQNNV